MLLKSDFNSLVGLFWLWVGWLLVEGSYLALKVEGLSSYLGFSDIMDLQKCCGHHHLQGGVDNVSVGFILLLYLFQLQSYY